MISQNTQLLKGKLLFCLSSLVFVCVSTFGQGPGGVSSNLQLWFSSDSGLSTDLSENVTLWSDLSGNNRHADLVFSDPAKVDSRVNFNPVVSFDGNDYLRFSSSPFANSFSSGEAVVVVKDNAFGSCNCGNPYDFGGTSRGFHYTWGNQAVYNGFGTNDRLGWRPLTLQKLDNKGGVGAMSGDPVDVRDYHIFHTYSAPGDWGTGFDGQFHATTSVNTVRFNLAGGNEHIGATSGNTFRGEIAEIILFDAKLTNTERQQLNTYLGLKYGIPLRDDLRASNSTLLWDVGNTAGFDEGIAGIGRDDNGNLNQKQSKSNLDGSIVTMSLGSIAASNQQNSNSFSSDLSYLIWGNEGGGLLPEAAALPSGAPANVLDWMERKWLVSESGTVGSVTLRMDEEIWRNVHLVVASNSSFSAGVTYIPMTETADGWELSYDFSDGQYFTFAGIFPSPGGVSSNLAVWLQANRGVDLVNSNELELWKDFSGNFRNGDLIFGDPEIDFSDVNFNPSLEFNGNDWIRFSSSPFANSFTQGEVFSVAKDNWYTSCNCGNPFDFGGSSRSFHYTWGNGYLYNGFGTNNRFGWNPLNKLIGDGKPGISAVSGKTVDPRDYHIFNTYSAPGQWGTGFDGEFAATTTNNTVSFYLAGGREHVGASSGYPFRGDISEIVLYNATLSSAQRSQVNTYLGVKYGLTLQSEYRAANGTLLWDVGNTGGFDHAIAGIARDDRSGLNQKQSRSLIDGTVVTIALDSIYPSNGSNPSVFSDDLSYGLWGHNDASVDISTVALPGAPPTGVEDWIQRNWLYKETGTIGSVYLYFESSVFKNVHLVTSDASDFSSNVVYTPMNEVDGGWALSFDLSNDTYYTFAGVRPAPGGVGADLQTWFKANDGFEANTSNNALSWEDRSGKNRHADIVAGDPNIQAGSLNFNPIIDFDGNDYFRFTSSPFVTSFTEAEVFSVLKDDAWSSCNCGYPFDFGGSSRGFHYTWGNAYIYDGFGTNNRLGWRPDTKAIIDGKPGVGSITGAVVDVRDWHIFHTFSKTNDWGTGFDGELHATTSSNTATFSLAGGNEHLGAVSGSIFRGDIGEVILYDRKVTDVERRRINTYLAIKYGILHRDDYLAADGSLLWDYGNTGGFDNDIAGIGRDAASDLHQKQSKSIQPDALVTIGLGSDIEATNQANSNSVINNSSFVLWGNNDGSQQFTALVSASQSNVRLGRTWKMDKHNWSDDNITLCFDNGNRKGHYLLVSADSLFSSIHQELDLTDSSGCVTFNSSLIPDGYYFTLGRELTAPGCVFDNLRFWVRTDLEISNPTDGAVVGVDGWLDLAGGASVSSHNNPTYQSDEANLINFHPRVRYVNQWHLWDTDAGLEGPGDFSILAAFAEVRTGETFIGTNPAPGGAIQYHINPSNPNNQGIWRFAQGNIASGTQTLNSGTPHIGGVLRNGSSFQMISETGNDGPAGTFAGSFTNVNQIYTGARNGGQLFDGDPLEVIIYNDALSPTEQQRIYSYLGVKYGLTIYDGLQDYLAGDGSIIWDAGSNSGFNHDIAGVGRDDCQGLNQLQSQSANSDRLVTIAVGQEVALMNDSNLSTITNDVSFMIWGNNDMADIFNVVVPAPQSNVRIRRVWQMDKTNWADQDITLCFSNGAFENYYLLVSSDSTFASVNSEIKLSDSTGCATFNSSLIPDGAFFTLGREMIAPGCVFTDLEYWIRPDDMEVVGSDVVNWDDVVGEHRDETMIGTGFQFNGAGYNFHPTAQTSGGGYMSWVGQHWLSGRTAAEIMYVLENLGSHSSNDGYPSEIGGGGSAITWEYDFSNSNIYSGWGSSVRKNWNPLTGSPAFDVLDPQIYQVLSKSGEWTARFNGTTSFTTASNTVNFNSTNSGNTHIGASHTSVFNGNISEVVLYGRELTATERARVQSYLAIKYGIAIDQSTPTDYLAGDGTVIWDASTHIGHLDGIAALGRDDCQGLHQKQARSTATGDELTIALGAEVKSFNSDHNDSITNDGSFLFWSNNDGSQLFTQQISVTANSTVRYGRSWQIDRHNWSDKDVTLCFDNADKEDYYLIIASDSNFSSILNEIPINDSTGCVTINSSLLSDGDYFTIGRTLMAPGCVFGSLRFWIRTDIGLSETVDNAVVGTGEWEDLVGDVQIASHNNPTLQNQASDLINYHPRVSYVNQYHQWDSDMGLEGSGDFTIVAAFAEVRSGETFIGTNPASAGAIQYHFDPDNQGIWRYAQTNITLGTQTLNAGDAHIGGLTRTGNSFQMLTENGNDGSTGTFAGSFANVNQIYTGARAGGQLFDGDVLEVAIYNRSLNSTELEQVHSYLALKYGITMSGRDYRAGNGDLIWDNSLHTGYGNDIAGIARDDCQLLNQKQSRSESDDRLVTMSISPSGPYESNATNPDSISNDASFLIWGNDDASIGSISFNAPAPYSSRILRVWKVDTTGTPNSVTVDFDLTKLPKFSYVDSEFALLRDSDTDFSDASALSGTIIGDTIIRFANVEFADNSYFTLAVPCPSAPGSVAGGLRLWLTAEDGLSGIPGGVEWQDRSGNDLDVATTVAGRTPVLQAATEANNYHQVIDFDGNDVLETDAQVLQSATSDGSVFFVGRYRDFSGYDSPIDFQADDPHIGRLNDNILIWNNGSSPNPYGPDNPLDLKQNQISGYKWDGGVNGGVELRVDGYATSNPNFDMVSIGYTSNFGVGAYISGAEGINGTLSEVLVYETNLSATDRQKVESYLAIKYGISLGQAPLSDYLASDGSSMFDASASVGYLNDIAGLGRDDCGSLLQKQSKSVNDGAILRMGLGSLSTSNATNSSLFGSDMSFMFWSHNGGEKEFSIAHSASAGDARMSRVWRVQETGLVDSVELCIPKSIEADYLLVSADPTFATGVTSYSLYGKDSFNCFSLDLTDGDFITFARESIEPGCVLSHTDGCVYYELYGTGVNGRISSLEGLTPSQTGYINGFEIVNSNPGTNMGYIQRSILSVATTGSYTFYLTSDDGSRLYIDGKLVVYNDYLQSATTRSASVTLEAGNHELEVRFAQSTGPSALSLEYEGPSVTRQVIPCSVLSAPKLNVRAWYRADKDLSVLGTDVTNWGDASLRNQDLSQSNSSNYPAYMDNAFNFNPAVNFEGDEHLLFENGIIVNDLSVLAVFTASPAGGFNTLFRGDQTDHPIILDGSDQLGYYDNGNGNYKGSGLTVSQSIPQIVGLSMGNGSSVSGDMELDGLAGTPATGIDPRISINSFGNNFAGGQPIGMVAEVIMYDHSSLSATDLAKMRSYLAIKYGITLDQSTPTDYLISDGTVVWDATANASFSNDIAGIGIDSCQLLVQKQSTSSNPDAVVQMGIGSIDSTNALNGANFSDDQQFMLWGNNNRAIEPQTPVTGSNLIHLARKWKVSEASDVGQVVFRIPEGLIIGEEPSLAISTDSLFESTDQFIALSLSGDYYECLVDFSDGDYFTIAQKVCAPGAVFADLQVWVKANEGVDTLSGGLVTDWYDQSGKSHHLAQATSSHRPNLQNPNDQFNGNRSLLFDGSVDHMEYRTGDRFFAVSDPGSVFGVAASSNTNNAWRNIAVLGVDNPHMGTFGVNARMFMNGSNPSFMQHPTTIQVNQSNLYQYGWVGGTNTGADIRIDGLQQDDPLMDFNLVGNSAATDGQFSVGGYETAENWPGNIAEVVAYNRDLTTQETERVESYLAVKYGLTLAHDYLASDATLLWDSSALAIYHNDVAGIGLDSNTCLNQKESQSINPTSIVKMGLGAITGSNESNPNSFGTDKSYMIWGHTLRSPDFEEPYSGTANVNYRMNRHWYLREEQTVAGVEIKIPASTGAEYLLVNSSDTAFGPGTIEVALLNDGNGFLIGNFDFQDGDYFSFAKKVCAPGGVVPQLSLWLKADTNVTLSGNSVSNWLDIDRGLDFSQASAGSRPDYNLEGLNFNQDLTFDGSNDFLQDLSFSLSPTNSSLFGVVSKSTHGTYRDILSSGNTQSIEWRFTPTGAIEYLENDGIVASVSSPNSLPLSGWNLYATLHDNNPNGVSVYENGAHVIKGTVDRNPSTTQSGVGRREQGGGFYLSGNIPELIAYDRKLDSLERLRVETYLALKYGLSANHDYLSSDGNVIWDYNGSGDFNGHIAGLIRDDLSCLFQKQSRNQQGGRITMGLSNTVDSTNKANKSLLSDMDYVLWASNNAANVFVDTTDVPTAFGSGCTERIRKVWKVVESGGAADKDNLKVVFDLTGLSHSGTSASDFWLLIDRNADGDFSDAEFLAATIYDTASVEFWAVNFDADGSGSDMFTIASKVRGNIPYTVPTGSSSNTLVECFGPDVINILDPLDESRRIAQIYLNGNMVNPSDLSAEVDAAQPIQDLFEAESGTYGRAISLIRRILYLNCSSCTGMNVNGGVTVRMYIDPVDISSAENRLDSLKTANGIVGVNALRWFKVAGTPSDVSNNLLVQGINLPGIEWEDALLPKGFDGTEYYYEFPNVTDFSSFGGAWQINDTFNSVLPIELIHFDASLIERKVSLNWSTALEIDNDYFIIEKSIDGVVWEALGKVQGSGNSTVQIDYQLWDNSPQEGMNYYRLWQVDLNGTMNFAGTKFVNVNWPKPFEVYPNPAKNVVFVKGELAGKTLSLINAVGQTVWTGIVETNTVELSVMKFPPGVYVLQVGESEREKIIIEK